MIESIGRTLFVLSEETEAEYEEELEEFFNEARNGEQTYEAALKESEKE